MTSFSLTFVCVHCVIIRCFLFTLTRVCDSVDREGSRRCRMNARHILLLNMSVSFAPRVGHAGHEILAS